GLLACQTSPEPTTPLGQHAIAVDTCMRASFVHTHCVPWQSLLDVFSLTEMPALQRENGKWYRYRRCDGERPRLCFAYERGSWQLEVYRPHRRVTVLPLHGATLTESSLILETSGAELLVLPFHSELGILEYRRQGYGLVAANFPVKRCR
ncbi:MAG TPA: hypothetical protein DCP28_36535, partial [Cytophagales bacterium]|nr:hypothetical protein [Cytophagales bacterium]